MIYVPQKWVVLYLEYPEMPSVYKVLAGWEDDTMEYWKLSSGILELFVIGDTYEFLNESGSVYVCDRANYGLTQLTEDRLKEFRDIEPGKLFSTVVELDEVIRVIGGHT